MSASASNTKHTNAFYLQAIASFVVSAGAVIVGVLYLDVSVWIRAFLLLGVLYLITSTVTMSKVIRDRDEANAIHHRVDAARLERYLTEFDPLRDPATEWANGKDAKNSPTPAGAVSAG